MSATNCAGDGCPNSLEGKRGDARFCGARCRARASHFRRLSDPSAAARKRETDRRWFTENRDRSIATTRQGQIKRRYGLTVEEYDAIIARGCAICGSHENVHLDHDHASGKVRDALCAAHNWMLGYAQDDPATLRAGAKYVEEHALVGLEAV